MFSYKKKEAGREYTKQQNVHLSLPAKLKEKENFLTVNTDKYHYLIIPSSPTEILLLA